MCDKIKDFEMGSLIWFILGGTDIITKYLIRQRHRLKRRRQYDNGREMRRCTLMGFKMVESAKTQRMLVASRNWKRKGKGLSPKAYTLVLNLSFLE